MADTFAGNPRNPCCTKATVGQCDILCEVCGGVYLGPPASVEDDNGTSPLSMWGGYYVTDPIRCELTITNINFPIQFQPSQ
jgi:hypothetical protein